MTRVKICGLTNARDVEVAVEAGANAVGFVVEPTSPRYLSLDDAEALARSVPPFVTTVAVFGVYTGSPVATHYVQSSDFNGRQAMHSILAVRVSGSEPFDPDALAPFASALVLDAFVPGEYGGTGKLIDWDLAAEIVRRSSRRVILAGGLNPDNVYEAVQRVKPYAVDVSSGVESAPRTKDHGKVRAFVAAATSR